MANYKVMYYKLFNSITDSIEVLEKSPAKCPAMYEVIDILKNAQIETEEIYIEDEEAEM